MLVALTSVLLSLRVRNDAYYIASRRMERFGLGWDERRLPIGAVEHARRVGLTGRVLNHLNFGGYLMWAAGQHDRRRRWVWSHSGVCCR